LGIVLPLAAIHLWIEVAARDVRSSVGGGVKTVLQRIGNALARAFEFDSVLTYALGLIIFVFVPYAILFVGKPPKGNKTDFAVFIARLLFVYVFTLIGWVVTLTTLAKIEPSPAAPVSTIAEAPAEAPA
jgi:drug/metabolite transporter (DMT)-like permease